MGWLLHFLWQPIQFKLWLCSCILAVYNSLTFDLFIKSVHSIWQKSDIWASLTCLSNGCSSRQLSYNRWLKDDAGPRRLKYAPDTRLMRLKNSATYWPLHTWEYLSYLTFIERLSQDWLVRGASARKLQREKKCLKRMTRCCWNTGHKLSSFRWGRPFQEEWPVTAKARDWAKAVWHEGQKDLSDKQSAEGWQMCKILVYA